MQEMDFDDLMVGFLSGTSTDEEQKQLTELLQTNEAYRMRYHEMTKTRAISLIPLIESEKEINYRMLKKQLTEKPISLSLFGYLYRIVAVCFFLLSTGIAGYYLYNDVVMPGDALVCYETIVPLGSQTKVILPDSTVVWLNSGSVLKYNHSFGKKTRDVYLTGEGYFEVRKNKNKPFLVHTNEIDVQVLGTVFNVRSYLEDVLAEVSLIEGWVNVSTPYAKENRSITLLPNEKLLYDKKSGQMSSSYAETHKSAQWTTGKLNFVNASFADIARDLQRKYDVRIQINTKQMKQEYFSGSINLALSIDDILKYIDVDKKYKWTQRDNVITIIDK